MRPFYLLTAYFWKAYLSASVVQCCIPMIWHRRALSACCLSISHPQVLTDLSIPAANFYPDNIQTDTVLCWYPELPSSGIAQSALSVSLTVSGDKPVSRSLNHLLFSGPLWCISLKIRKKLNLPTHITRIYMHIRSIYLWQCAKNTQWERIISKKWCCET